MGQGTRRHRRRRDLSRKLRDALIVLFRGGEPEPVKREEQGPFVLDEDDLLLIALLSDPIYCAELLGEDPSNHAHGGMYKVRDYQYTLFRIPENYAGVASARTVGKSESVKWRSVTHAFRRIAQNLLITAPELIHLLPLTDSIEHIYRSTRILREFLDTRGGKTGFTHRPFGIDMWDGTKVVGRIPRLTGTGVKGQHQPDLIIDEAQDYPEKGWVEVHETVMKDTVDRFGKPDFSYHFYGVHSGARDSGFHDRASRGAFKIVNVTALQRRGWNAAEKAAAIAAYGSTSSPDYRRNILGEAGAAATPFFVTARLVACMDQDRESVYNQREYRKQVIRAEEFAEAQLPIEDVLDLPSLGPGAIAHGGMDIGLTNSPSVITLWTEETVKGVLRLKLRRRIHLERMATREQRHAIYAIYRHFGASLVGFGMDVTGLGLPIFQEMRDDPDAPAGLEAVLRDYFFNSKIPVAVDKTQVSEDQSGRMRDRFGNAVEIEEDVLSGMRRYVIRMPMIEASTRYLREWVDTTYLLLPFDQEIIADMNAESQQRVKAIAGLKNKPNAFHILDSMRAMAMSYHAAGVEAELEVEQPPVLDMAL